LVIYLEFDDCRSAAGVYHNLGNLAHDQGGLDKAKANYRRALDVFLELGDRHSAAMTYHQLGTLAEEEDRAEEAETNYRDALDLFVDSDDRHLASSAATCLGTLLLERGEVVDAAGVLIFAATSRYQGTREWPSDDVSLLQRVRDALGREQFSSVLHRIDLAEGLAEELEEQLRPNGSQQLPTTDHL
jgi:tetratricopeptide (TPR) repeat protein